MSIASENLNQIRAFRSLGEKLGTAGQPTRAQFEIIRASGFEAVVNLALPTSDDALANEGSVVTGLGMAYVHIPVKFDAPAKEDFETFCGVMDTLGERPVFVHCAANMRVSAFAFLYRVLRKGADIAEAERDLHAIWEPDGVWNQFILRRLGERS